MPRSAKKIVKKSLLVLPIAKRYVKRKDFLEKLVTDQSAFIEDLKKDNSAHSKANAELINTNQELTTQIRRIQGEGQHMRIIWPVSPQEIIDADWMINKKVKLIPKGPTYIINWVVPPMGSVSGGHTDIFRAIQYLESQGHTCRLYFYDALKQSSLVGIQELMKKYPAVQAEVFYNKDKMADCDAIFATNWYTAYPVYNYNRPAKKFYFVQDFEPFFDPVGSYSTLAENTYKFGFHGVTLGNWLSEKLSKEYNMKCDPINLGYESSEYFLTNKKPRKKIVFYARPVTPRRAFELGILSLDLFHKKHPEYEINLFGWDLEPYEIPFPYVNHGILDHTALNKLYNECAVGLVLSFTNMSLIPLEMLAAGCKPIINDAYHTQKVEYKALVNYATSSPTGIVSGLEKALKDTKTINSVQKLAEGVVKFQWHDSFAKLDQVLINELS